MIRYTRPFILDYVAQCRARREREDQAFRERRAAAIAKQAVNDQGVGE